MSDITPRTARLAEKILAADGISRGFDEIGRDWGDKLWWFTEDGGIHTAPARWEGPSTQDIWQAEQELKELKDEMEDLKFEISHTRSAPKPKGESGPKKDPVAPLEHKMKELEHREQKLKKIIDSHHPQYSDAKHDLDQLHHGRIHLDNGHTADTHLHGTYEERTGTLTWTDGKQQVMPQNHLPEDLLQKLHQRFNIKHIQRF